MIEEFERHLRGTNLSENTISSYLFALRQYSSQYDGITKKNLRAYKVWLIENYKPKTVNLRLRAINCYLMSTEQTPVFFAAPKYPAMLSKLAKGRTESYGDSARGPTWQSHEQRFPAALQ